jgi:Uma2 family endonuclease
MASSTGVLVPLEEYLHSSYRPDRDWIDGETRERNMGEWAHAGMQGFLIGFFRTHAADWKIWILPEQRVQTSASHFRIPDVCVVTRETPFQPILKTPPLLCIEILSREDSMSEIQERVEDYLAMGVRAVWVIDPRRRKAYTTTDPNSLQAAAESLSVPGTEIRLPIADAWAELEQMGAYRME